MFHFDRDAVLLGIGQEFLAREQIPLAPRRDDFDIGVQRVGAEFEAHLVIALAGGAMGNRIGAGGAGDFDQTLGDQRARDRGAEQVLAFIDGVGAEHRKHEIAHELFAQIVDEDFLHAKLLGFFARGFQFFTLADIGGEGDDFALIFILQPFQNDRGIQAAGIGEYDFFDLTHGADFSEV